MRFSVERVFSYIAFAVMTALVVTPAFRDPPRDSFPFSDFPMFSRGRPDPMLTITHALGVTQSGERQPLAPLVSAGNEEVLQSMRIIHQGVTGNDPLGFCQQVAARVAQDASLNEVERVEIATSVFDCVAYFDGETAPQTRRVHQHCPVLR